MKLTTKIHPKGQKLAFLLPFALELGRFVGVVMEKWAWSKNFRARIIILAPPLLNVCIRPCKATPN